MTAQHELWSFVDDVSRRRIGHVVRFVWQVQNRTLADHEQPIEAGSDLAIALGWPSGLFCCRLVVDLEQKLSDCVALGPIRQGSYGDASSTLHQFARTALQETVQKLQQEGVDESSLIQTTDVSSTELETRRKELGRAQRGGSPLVKRRYSAVVLASLLAKRELRRAARWCIQEMPELQPPLEQLLIDNVEWQPIPR